MTTRASALVFDIDDTLYDLAGPYRAAYSELFAGRWDLPVDELFLMSRVHSDEALDLLMAGKISAEDHKALRAQWTFADWGVELSREEALAFQAAYAQAQERIEPYPEAVEALRVVREAGIPLGVISNGDGAHQRHKLALLGLDAFVGEKNVVVSGECGANKPSPVPFREMERRLGVSEGDIWYVGDTYETDIIGAKQAGWKALWVDVRGREVPDVPERPDMVVHNPAEMLQAIESLIPSTKK